ncbi:MAG: 50S ribosomal protein L4, partial [Staphylococcus epidermidis]|nr:50S ribosomal protein L4 [Staphylococcus epidermidis]
KVLVVTENEDVNVELSARNIPGVQVTIAQGLNVLDLTSADSVIITEPRTVGRTPFHLERPALPTFTNSCCKLPT